MRQLHDINDSILRKPLLRIAVSVFLYGLGFLLIYPFSGISAGVLVILPVLLVAWNYGLRAGLIASLLSIPLNVLLLVLVDDISLDTLSRQGAPGFAVTVAVAAVAGYLRDTNRQLKDELAEQKQSGERYRLAIASAGAVPYYLDYKTNSYPMLGEGFLELTGYPPEMVGHELWDAIRLDIQLTGAVGGMTVQEGVERVRSGEIAEYECDILIRTRSGEKRWLHDTSTQVLDDHGKPIGAAGVLLDITERRQAEEALLASQQLLQAIIDNSAAVIYVKDLQGRYLLINRRFEDTFHVTLATVTGKTDQELFAEDSSSTFRSVDQQISVAGKALEVEETARHDDGLHTYLSIKCPLYDESGKPYAVCSVSTDVTERQRAVEREVRRREWLEKVLELSKKVTQITDWQACLLAIYEGVRYGLEFDRVGLFVYDSDSRVMRGVYGTNRAGERSDLSSYSEPIRDGIIFREGLSSKKTFVHIPDYSARFPNTPPEEDIHNVKEHATVGVWSGDMPVMALAVDNVLTERPMTEEQLEALRLFAIDAGLAIQNVRLYTALQRELMERKQAEVALRASEERYRKTIITAGAVPYSIDYRTLSYTFLGEGILQMTGYNTEEMNPQLWKSLELEIQLLGELADLPYNEARRKIRSGEVLEWKSDSRIRTRTGETRWISDSSFQIMDDDGTITGAIGILQDITQRKQAEEALRASEERFRYAAMATRDAIYDWDIINDTTLRNEAYLTLYFANVPADEQPIQWEKYVHPDDRDQTLESVQQAFREQKHAWSGEYRMRQSDGEYASVIDRAYIVYNEAGQAVRMIGAMTDLTERKHADAQRFELALVKERAEVLKQFLNTISHDLKTPLTIINNSLYLLQKVADPEYQKSRLEQIKVQAQRLEKLIQDVLTVSRLDTVPELTFERLNINQVVERLATQFQGVAENRHLTINLQLDENLPLVRGSEDELHRVLVNLVENALHYTSPEGEVTLRTSTEGDQVMVEVQDTGIGISEADLPHIFDHFYRTDKARATATGGTGLGLSIVKKIVDMHEGSIEVESTVGQGTTMRLRLRAQVSS